MNEIYKKKICTESCSVVVVCIYSTENDYLCIGVCVCCSAFFSGIYLFITYKEEQLFICTLLCKRFGAARNFAHKSLKFSNLWTFFDETFLVYYFKIAEMIYISRNMPTKRHCQLARLKVFDFILDEWEKERLNLTTCVFSASFAANRFIKMDQSAWDSKTFAP